MDFKSQGATGIDTYTLKITRDSDGYMYDFNDGVFKSSGWSQIAGTLIEVDPSNNPGYYKISINTTSWSDGYYTLNYCDSTGTYGNIDEIYIYNGKSIIPILDNVYETTNSIKTKTDNLPSDPADESEIDSQLEDIKEYIMTILSRTSGAGAIQWTYTLTVEGTGEPIPDADIWITSDVAGKNILASGRTDAYGVAKFYLDVGTVYVWRQKSGYNFDNPDIEEVG